MTTESPATRTVRSATISGGLRLPYVEQGAPSGLPVVLLHGYSDSWRSFERLLPHLPRSLRTFAVTQRGHGDADRPTTGYALEQVAADVAAFMDAVGLEAAVIVGDSSASYTAQRYAIDHPRRTLGLVLMSAVRSFRDIAGVSTLAEMISELRDPIDPAFVRAFQETTLFHPVPPAFLETVIAESCKLPARVWKAALEGLLEADPPTEVASITAPTMILWGERDEYCLRADQEALAAAIPGSRLVTYEETGHAVHWEQPERVAVDLVEFVKRVAPGTSEA